MSGRSNARLAGPGVIGHLMRKRDERGAMLLLSAAGLVLAMIFAALAVDIGFLAADKRTDQKVADLAALDAVRDLAGVAANCSAPPTASGPLCPAVISAMRNVGVNDAPKTVSAQLVKPDGSGDYVADAAGSYVRVTVSSPRKPFFPFVSGNSRTVTARAVAGGIPEAEFSVGSTLAAIDVRKSALDPILGPMLGLTSANMNLVSYDGLATGDVGLRALQTNLLALGYDVGTTDKLLNTSVRASDLLRATATALTANGDTVAAAEINDIPLALIPNLRTVSLGRLISLSQPGSDSALDATLNAFNIVSGAAEVANGSSFIAVPGLTASVPGVTSFAVALKVIEPPQSAKGPVNAPAYTTQAKTSQVALQVTLNLLPLLGNTLTVTVNLTAGNGQATLTDIDCSASPGITLHAATSGATIDGSGIGVNLLGIPLLGTLTLGGSVAPAAAVDRDFAYPTQFVPPVGPSPAFSQHVGVANVGLSPTTLTVGGTGVLGALSGVLQPVIQTALTTLDGLLVPTLGPILKVLGLDLAGADLSAVQIFQPPPSCDAPRLVK